ERHLWAYALERGRGESFTLEDLHAATARAPYIHDPLNPEQFSIQPVLDRETAIIQLAQESSNACASSLVPDWPGDERLDAAQAELVRKGRSALVVSPTWGEIHRVNDAVRRSMQAAGLIGKKEWAVSALQADDLTDAQK